MYRMAGGCGKAVNSLEVKKIDLTRVLWWKKNCEERNIVKEEFIVLVTDKHWMWETKKVECLVGH